ncbi:peptidoglycan DD-metalloendopeptidase family protein [Flavobacterium sp. Sd200]|uniref:M23 family metallopeptidase n=1 Tax=Flavobacterium sp. Sd200 TaxID=2692211 RepID=UPI00136C543A|nr:M23 family metallopeptidase [Flavobacterium sp. Sd200]MXN92564.1 peptidoglycan DD-metalloendopeptidase family protein [Flavobacterium sp. Sd200]
MTAKRLKKQIIKKRLFTKNRLVILNEDSFEEIFSLRLNVMNVFVGVTLISIVMIALTTYIIAGTPLREYIPGYASTKLKREATENAVKSDSLIKVLEQNTIYLANIKKVLTGEIEHTKLSRDSIVATGTKELAPQEMKPSDADLKLRDQVALEDKYNLFEQAQPRVSQVLFAPVKGHITEPYNARKKQFFINIAVANNTPVKAIASGTVLLADWSPTNGNVIMLRHNDGIISVYKNAGSVTKQQGDVVRSGEVVALAGAGVQKKDAQLHFELWKDGYPIDPTQFIDFE